MSKGAGLLSEGQIAFVRQRRCLVEGEGGTLVSDRIGGLLARGLSLDLEVGRKDHRIHAFAGIRTDLDRSLTFPTDGVGLGTALARLDDFADGAEFLLGHKLIDFDLPRLQAENPGLRLLRLPAVDTLLLSPLAFPRNPYHRLVKHYQDGGIRRGCLNDPELDAKLALEVFSEQLTALRSTSSDLLAAWHWLTTLDGGEGFDRVFADLRKSGRPPDTEARAAIRACLAGISCQQQALEVMAGADSYGWNSLMRWRGCLCLVATRLCLLGYGISSPSRVVWSSGCGTSPAPTPLVVGAGRSTMPAKS